MCKSMVFSLPSKSILPMIAALAMFWPAALPARTANNKTEVAVNLTEKAEVGKEFPISPKPSPVPDIIGTWQRWEHLLTSHSSYPNPCTEVTLEVRFDGPDGRTRQGLGFWDGDRRFVIRGVFPTPGKWQWTTICSDTANAGLHGQSGRVDVKPTSDSNPLMQHGYLRVSDDSRLLVHTDGTPFLWIGDTCWAAPLHAAKEEWMQYVVNRAAKGYTVLQLSIAPDWALEHSRLGIPPFLSTLPDITKPNPKFFQEMDRKLAMANDHGLVVMMCGLMETPYRYPPPEQTAVLSRYVAARYSSFSVIFSPSFDSGIHEAETLASANAIRQAAPHNLITMHMGTAVGPHFHSADWLSFDMYQSGHNSGNAGTQSARAIGMPAEILSLSPRKPIINGEAIYEGELGGAYDVRRTAWLSLLSGAVGYTAGINELYQWKEDAIAKINLPSSDQIALLARIMKAIPWWQLEPQPKRILNQPTDRSRLMAVALSTDQKLGIAYLPGNDALEINLEGCTPSYNVLWINPASGQSQNGTAIVSASKTTLTAPDKKDWVAVFAAPDSQAIALIKKALTDAVLPKPKSTASIVFTKEAPVDGLVKKEPSDGVFVRQKFNGTDCIVNESPKHNNYLYIDLDDRLAFRSGLRRMTVEIQLQSDDPLEGIQLQYDAKGPAEKETIYKPLSSTSHKKQDGWTVIIFEAESPYLGNRQNSSADFRVSLDGRLCHIASVKVTLEKSREAGN